MAYIELVNAFWNKRAVWPLSSCEADFYFYLLKECNSRRWTNPFKLPTQIIERDLNLNRRSICEIRNKLQQNGYIRFTASTKRGEITEYEIVDISIDPYENANRTQTERKPNANRTQSVTQNKEKERTKENEIYKKLDKEISSDEDIKKVGRSVFDRRKDFYDLISPYVSKYGQKMVDDFCAYWTRTIDDTTMRFEKELKFSVGGRLATWYKNGLNLMHKVTDIAEKEREYQIDWAKVRAWYISLGLSLERWTEDRKRAYISIIDSYGGDMNAFREAIIRFSQEVKKSDWILGLSNSPMRDFTWLFTESNFVKVIDGRYSNNDYLKQNGRTNDARRPTAATEHTNDEYRQSFADLLREKQNSP